MVEDVEERSNTQLVERAGQGEQDAWAELVARFQPLVTSVTRRHRLSTADAADVSQTVWMRLVDRLPELRDPRALPGWLATTTANACLAVIASQRRTVSFDPLTGWSVEPRGADRCDPVQPDELLLREETRRAVRAGLAELTPVQRQLLLLVMADPPVPYAQISRRLGVPVGSIGPTRSRCLQKLSCTRAVRELLGASSDEGRSALSEAA